jgi:DNA-binding response OmpR family regulator
MAEPPELKVLVVDDAPEFRELLEPLLRGEGYEVATASDGLDALDRVQRWGPDVIVLDLGLPGLDGIEVCRRLRQWSDAYVIMLTSRTEEVDRVVGLEVGADDYLTKPFSPRELVARVRAMLRRPRSATPGPSTRTIDELVIDPAGRTATVSGNEVSLTRIEFDLLDVLSGKPTMVFSRSMLREQVWGTEWFGDDHVVDVHIANLRKKIDRVRTGSHIRTVRGIGYRMEGRSA